MLRSQGNGDARRELHRLRTEVAARREPTFWCAWRRRRGGRSTSDRARRRRCGVSSTSATARRELNLWPCTEATSQGNSNSDRHDEIWSGFVRAWRRQASLEYGTPTPTGAVDDARGARGGRNRAGSPPSWIIASLPVRPLTYLHGQISRCGRRREESTQRGAAPCAGTRRSGPTTE
jgi:hypothetical protein